MRDVPSDIPSAKRVFQLPCEIHASPLMLPTLFPPPPAPQPCSYVDVADTFVTCTAALELEAYRYRVITAASGDKAAAGKGGAAVGGRKNAERQSNCAVWVCLSAVQGVWERGAGAGSCGGPCQAQAGWGTGAAVIGAGAPCTLFVPLTVLEGWQTFVPPCSCVMPCVC